MADGSTITIDIHRNTVMSEEDINRLVSKLGPAVSKSLFGPVDPEVREMLRPVLRRIFADVERELLSPDRPRPLPATPEATGRAISAAVSRGIARWIRDGGGEALRAALRPGPPKPLTPQAMHATPDPEG